MNGTQPAPGLIVACSMAMLAVATSLAVLPAAMTEKTARYSVRIVDSRGTWVKGSGPTLVADGKHDLTVRSGTTIEFHFESADYVYMLSQAELGLDLVVIPQQTCTASVVVETPGRYDITARGFCGDLWQHTDPPLRIVCHP